ncbi:HD domain-containing protein [Microbacterium sp. BR1]|uniref:HD domain-containing protein n=1 Tax=Microbacterium sp. BR1 TaxID=1070896 RepID=UPI000C2B98EB|nr:HD domain-containing protein [Microbacterium sp. BR1]
MTRFLHTFDNVQTLGNGQSPRRAYTDLDDLWRAAEPYMRARRNDIHIPLSFSFAELLLDDYPDADERVARVAILLHDVGWARVDAEAMITDGFRSENWRQSDARILHEAEGCAIARELLPPLGFDDAFVTKVTDIIDGHDTRLDHRSLEDAIVRDADRLWRFTPTGTAFSAEWFGRTPREIVRQLEDGVLDELITASGRRMAEAELVRTIELLKIDLL